MAFLDKFRPRPRGQAGDDLLRSVIENLRQVLNTRRGYGFFRPDFGMSDPNAHHTRARIVEDVMREVRHNIENYEPRLRVLGIVTVPADNPMRLAFTLRCTVQGDPRALHLEFDTVHKSVAVGSFS